jgi:hypothetical protein
MLPTGYGGGDIPGVRSVARTAVPGVRAAIAGAIVRVSRAGTIFPGAEVGQARASRYFLN